MGQTRASGGKKKEKLLVNVNSRIRRIPMSRIFVTLTRLYAAAADARRFVKLKKKNNNNNKTRCSSFEFPSTSSRGERVHYNPFRIVI